VENGYCALPLRSDNPDFGINSAYLLNLTTSQIGVVLGTAKTTLAPRKSSVLQPGFILESAVGKRMRGASGVK
jgi:hypothetical protein